MNTRKTSHISRTTTSLFSHEEVTHFCIQGFDTKNPAGKHDDRLDPDPFPRTAKKRQEYIFARTGFSATPMNWRGWYCFNYAMNQGLDIGISTDPGDKTLMMLSLIDHALSQPPRFVGMPQIPFLRADSSTAHSKQSMNLCQRMFENAGFYNGQKLQPGLEGLNSFRRDAMLGTWVHDMGECIFEIVTASERFGLSKEENTWVGNRKNEVETKVFTFACQLALDCINRGRPEEFLTNIDFIRDSAINAPITPNAGESEQLARLRTRMDAMEAGMAEVTSRLGLPEALAPETKHLSDIFHRTEADGSFLNSFVKTLEGLEGNRYLQRNAVENPTEILSRKLHGEDKNPQRPGYDLFSDLDITHSIRRAERRLPTLFNLANGPHERKLAKATAAFVYGTVARQFTPKENERVAVAPAIIDRAPTVPDKHDPFLLPELKKLRATEMVAKEAALATQNPDDVNAQYYSRERAGALYRAAERLIGDGTRAQDFIPNTACLLLQKDTPEIPTVLLETMKEAEQGKLNAVTSIRSR